MLEDMRLTARQKMRSIKLCESQGIPAHEYEWKDVQIGSSTAPLVSKLIHTPSSHYFLFDRYATGGFLIKFSPAEDKRIDEKKLNNNDWEYVWSYFQAWAGYLADEIKAENYLRKAMGVTPINELLIRSEDNSPFTITEQSQIAAKLDLLQSDVFSLKDFQQEEATRIRAYFGNLKTELNRAGRNAWFQMLWGTILTLGMTYLGSTLTQQVVQEVEIHIGPFYLQSAALETPK